MDIALWVPFWTLGPLWDWESGLCHYHSLGAHPNIFRGAAQYFHCWEHYQGSHFPVLLTRQQKLWVKLTAVWQSFPQTRGSYRVLRLPGCQTQCHCHGQLHPTFDGLKVQNHQLLSSALMGSFPFPLGWKILLQPFDLTQDTDKCSFSVKATT